MSRHDEIRAGVRGVGQRAGNMDAQPSVDGEQAGVSRLATFGVQNAVAG